MPANARAVYAPREKPESKLAVSLIETVHYLPNKQILSPGK